LRQVCGSAAAWGFAGSLGRFGMVNALAQSSTPNYKALVCIFLFGGNDGNNLIVPMSSYSSYAGIRGPLALAQNTLLQAAAVTGGATYGFHPNLPGLQQLFTSKKLAIVANVGTLVKFLSRDQYQQGSVPVPFNLFSHADQQTEWQTGIPASGARSGWGGRVADAISFMNLPATFPTGLSVAGNSSFLNGVTTVPTALIPGSNPGLAGSTGSTAANARDASFQQLLTFNSGLTLVQSANAVTTEGLNVANVLKSVLSGNNTLTTVFPNSTLGQELQQVASIIKVRAALNMNRQVFFVSLGGFDTHTNQIADQGALFTDLSASLLAFYNATVELGVDQQVTTFTESDFGRTFQPSSGGGSDHAWGSHHLVMGSAVKGGDVYGSFPEFALGSPNDADNRGVWIPTTALDQFGATLAAWFGLGMTDLNTVFPDLANYTPTTNLGFV